ncbi:MAG: hypothetical protein HQM10_23165 [Candidatus Riflebacteria bacterium]|nr:hypothetical protein [Candidatus Riflebacteria bacterium]
MKQLSHFSLLLSIAVCIFFIVSFVFEPKPVYLPPDSTFPAWQPLQHAIAPVIDNAVLSSYDGIFRSKFFETAVFKGVTRNSSGLFSAIFMDSSNCVFSLKPSQTVDGVTIVEVSSQSCRLKIGSSSRELSVSRKNSISH